MRILTNLDGKKKAYIPEGMGRERLIKREKFISDHIPISHFIDTDILGTRDGDMMMVVHMNGSPSETFDQETLNIRLKERAHLFLSAASQGLQIYYHFIRRKEKFFPEGEFLNSFSRDLDKAWEKKLDKRRQYRNDHYLTILIRPQSEEISTGFFKKQRILSPKARAEAIRRLRELTDIFVTGLRDYEPRILHMTPHESEALSLFGFLLNGVWRRYAPPSMNLANAISENRLFFARETLSIHGMTDENSRVAAIIGFKEYPSETYSSMFEGVFRVGAEFAMTQTFSPVLRDKAQAAIQLQQRRMAVAEDAAASLREQLTGALDDLASGRLMFGTHHIGVTVFSETLDDLQSSLSLIRGQLTNSGLTVVREDMLLEPAFWAQFPGNLAYAGGRSAMISSANFASLVSLSSTPQGQASSIWGPAITVFETSAATPYLFNFHVKDVGNTVVFGPTGAGKTALLSFLIAQAERVHPRIIIMDKDRGAEILVRALGGKYSQIVPGIDSRLNPFLIEADSPAKEAAARAFLRDWVAALLYGAQAAALPPAAIQAIKVGVDEVRDAPAPVRRLSLLREALGGGELGDDLLDRLAPWVGSGERAWAFDSQKDEFSRLFENRIMGVDLTKILDDPRAAAPWMMYLFDRIESALTDGQPTLIVLDEAWRLLADETFAARIQNWMKVIRKLNGAVVFATQEPEDAAKSPVGRTVIQQSPTQILLPNPRASDDAYRGALRLSGYELDLIRSIGAAGRYMMIRRNDRSVLVNFDLGGMPEFIDVLSARASSIAEVDELRARFGDDPENWLPEFMKRRLKK